ncbi:MAG: anti-sigma factor antagonist, partial [Bacteroidia bacterium]|nr:anti-sigma factor antagonist [Bacteroidia bacterium]
MSEMDEKVVMIEELRNGVKIIRLQNVLMLDPGLANSLTDILVKKFESGELKILLNFSRVARMSSLFFRSFIIAGKKAKTVNGILAFSNVSPVIQSGFEMMGLNQYFNFK